MVLFVLFERILFINDEHKNQPELKTSFLNIVLLRLLVDHFFLSRDPARLPVDQFMHRAEQDKNGSGYLRYLT